MAEKKTPGIAIIIAIVAAIILFNMFFNSPDALQERSAIDDVNNFLNIFIILGQGDADGFSQAFPGAMSFIGLFIVVFAVYYFLSTTVLKTLFKRKNTALIFALVVTVYSFFNNKMYNYLISFNAYTVGLLVFLALIKMLFGTGLTVKDSYDESRTAEKKARALFEKAKAEYEQEKYK